MTTLCRQKKGEHFLPNFKRMENKNATCVLCCKGNTCLGESCLGSKPSISKQRPCQQVSSSSSIPGSVGTTSTSLLKISKSPCSTLRNIPRCPELLEMFKAKPVSLREHSRPSPSRSPSVKVKPSLKVKPVKNESTL